MKAKETIRAAVEEIARLTNNGQTVSGSIETITIRQPFNKSDIIVDMRVRYITMFTDDTLEY